MASPPFNINQALPGDTDIVSQHPVNARQFRDIVESWLLINHDTNGQHFRVEMPRSSTGIIANPVAGVDVLFVSLTGRLKIKHSDGTEEYVGNPPGLTGFTGGAVPVGWLAADGSAVSRSTFADLFTEIGTTFGVGDGSTTFNVPDVKGRVIASLDAAAGRFTSAPLMGNTIGLEFLNLIRSDLPNINMAAVVTDPGHTHSVAGAASGALGSPRGFSDNGGLTFPGVTSGSSVTGISVATFLNGNVTQTIPTRAQPTITMRAIVKY